MSRVHCACVLKYKSVAVCTPAVRSQKRESLFYGNCLAVQPSSGHTLTRGANGYFISCVVYVSCHGDHHVGGTVTITMDVNLVTDGWSYWHNNTAFFILELFYSNICMHVTHWQTVAVLIGGKRGRIYITVIRWHHCSTLGTSSCNSCRHFRMWLLQSVQQCR